MWSVSCDQYRFASGGRGGEVRVWSLSGAALSLARNTEDLKDIKNDTVIEERANKGRVLYEHTKSSSVASIHIDRFGLVSGDGLTLIIQWDFWESQHQSSPCQLYKKPVPDRLL